MKDILAILGSSRSQGNTRLLLDTVLQSCPATLINLNGRSFSTYDYSHQNQNDDFLALASQLADVRAIIFATPVYWYAMSAQMKIFFDRFSDLITIRKDLGRSLKGKSTFLLATGTDNEVPVGCEVPVERTSQYLDMEFRGSFYASFETDLSLSTSAKVGAQNFARKVLDSTAVTTV